MVGWIPQALRQLSATTHCPCQASTTEAQAPAAHDLQEKPLQREAHALQLESRPCLPQLEKAQA